MDLREAVKTLARVVGAHQISTRPCDRRVQVIKDGLVLADTDRAVELHETGQPTRFYLPRGDVRMDLLAASDTRSHCPFKGDATYFSAPGAPDAFWTYPQPSETAALPIARMLAPQPDRVDIRV